MNPILSIVVATRNRIPYCINLIETILSFTYDNFELVIQDNSESSELCEFVKTKEFDKRLIYNYTNGPFSSIDNFNAAIGLASGQYISLIGDDDGVTNEIFILVEWMKRNSIDAVNPKLNVMYRWPDACGLLDRFNEFNGNLEIFGFDAEITSYRTDRELNKLLNYGGQNYLEVNLPKPYHGIVKKSYLDIIKKETKFFVGGLSPDIYMAVSLSKYIKEVYVIGYPIILPGVCFEALTRSHLDRIENIEDAPHMRNRLNYKWAKQVPYFYSPNTIWADSMISALNDLNMIKEIKRFNVLYLCYILIRNFPNRKEELNSHIATFSFAGCRLKMIYFTIYFMQHFVLRLLNRIRRLFFASRNNLLHYDSFKEVENINMAITLLMSKAANSKISLTEILK
jgi:glycosyltransferase involved in cell wall biosynthesis